MLNAEEWLFPPRLRLRWGFGGFSDCADGDSLLKDLIIEDTESETLLPIPGELNRANAP